MVSGPQAGQPHGPRAPSAILCASVLRAPRPSRSGAAARSVRARARRSVGARAGACAVGAREARAPGGALSRGWARNARREEQSPARSRSAPPLAQVLKAQESYSGDATDTCTPGQVRSALGRGQTRAYRYAVRGQGPGSSTRKCSCGWARVLARHVPRQGALGYPSSRCGRAEPSLPRGRVPPPRRPGAQPSVGSPGGEAGAPSAAGRLRVLAASGKEMAHTAHRGNRSRRAEARAVRKTRDGRRGRPFRRDCPREGAPPAGEASSALSRCCFLTVAWEPRLQSGSKMNRSDQPTPRFSLACPAPSDLSPLSKPMNCVCQTSTKNLDPGSTFLF
nr:translation initiation factor IF-2-like [Manis javanica]